MNTTAMIGITVIGITMTAITASILEIVTGSIIIVTTVTIAQKFLSSLGASQLLGYSWPLLKGARGCGWLFE
ncbi:MAG: hypothetical protein JO331_06290 [Verrucomicrobia bacterium]|nr:hypothetical protein [Verrucomicrobiota bacterium]